MESEFSGSSCKYEYGDTGYDDTDFIDFIDIVDFGNCDGFNI